MNGIKVKKKGISYDAEWIEKYSDINNDVAVLRVKDAPFKPIEIAHRLYKGLKVIIWGFPLSSRKNYPYTSGKYKESNLQQDKLEILFGSTSVDGRNKWNKKPDQSIELYPIKDKLEKGFSGAPVFYKDDPVVIGMYEAQDADTGYVIPIEKIMLKLITPKKELAPSVSVKIDSILDKGNELFGQEEYKQAITYYDKVINDNNLLSAYNNKGKALSNLGNQDDALKNLDRALEINPKYSSAWNNKGYVFYIQNKYPEAIECFDKAIEIDNKYAFAWTGKGECLFESADFERALACFNKSLEINPNFPRAASRKGQCLKKLGDIEGAMQCWNKALIMSPEPKDADEWNNRGFNLNEMGKYDEAIVSLERALRINKNHYRALLNMGYSQLKKQNYRLAAKYFQDVIDLNVNDADAWWFKGEALKFDNEESAKRCFARALEINPKYEAIV
jgi:tetratricopeptide (TPR) repeat protein